MGQILGRFNKPLRKKMENLAVNGSRAGLYLVFLNIGDKWEVIISSMDRVFTLN